MTFEYFFKRPRDVDFFWLFLFIFLLLFGSLLVFFNSERLDTNDFLLIAWQPGHELLAKGSIDTNYPYPLWTVVVLIPFILLPLKASLFLWFVFNLMMLAASLAIFIQLFDFGPSLLSLVPLVVISGYYPPVIYGLWYGQLTTFSLLALALSTRYVLRGNWIGLGIILGLSFIKPQIMILPAGLLLLFSLWQRNWRTLFGFGTTILTLILISLPFVSSPAQIIGGGVASHLETYIGISGTLWGLCLSLGLSIFVPIIVSLGLMIWIGWIWLPFVCGAKVSVNQMLFLFSAAVLTNLIIIPYSWIYNLTLLLMPLGYSLSMALNLSRGIRLISLSILFFVMHPLVLILLILDHDQHSYLIISALMLFVVMLLLKRHTAANENKQNTEHVLSGSD